MKGVLYVVRSALERREIRPNSTAREDGQNKRRWKKTSREKGTNKHVLVKRTEDSGLREKLERERREEETAPKMGE